MQADISANTFRPQEHFAAIVVGQGQVLVDSAINEQEQIARYRQTTTTGDVVGVTGVPKLTGGFAVTVAPDGQDLLLSPGRMYVDGILCENDPTSVGAIVGSTNVLTVDSATPDGVPFAVGQWVDVTAATTSRVQIASVAGRVLTLKSPAAGLVAAARVSVQPVTSLLHQPDRLPFALFTPFDPNRLAPGANRVELDVWHRHISPVEDVTIREVALGDAEASTRIKVVWQLRLSPAGAIGGGSCLTGIGAPRGALAASTVPGLPSDDPCVLPDEAGYRGLENQLYRVEVHSSTSTEVVLKWQRDNASTESKVLALGSTLLLDDMGRDDERGFATAPLVEITDDYLELEQQVSDLIAVSGPPDPSNRTLTLASAPTAAKLARNARARRWDGQIVLDLTAATAGQPVVLERGVQVALGGGVLRPGDYWMIPARTSNSAGGGTITWPNDDDGNSIPLSPQGIDHHVTSLALVDSSMTAFLTAPTNLRECRTLFPPLTAIAAADVSVDPTPCGFRGDVKTVQDAIDELCHTGGADGCCTVTATPGMGWEKVFASVAAGANAQICFPVGAYPTPNPVSVSGKGHLILHGCGLGSVLSATGAGLVINFSSCTSVTVEALSVHGAPNSTQGALTFTQCGAVTVRKCGFVGAAGTTKQAACLSATGGTLQVEDTAFVVGNLQTGVLAVNTTRAVVRDSRFTVAALPAGGGGAITSATKLERLQARRLLVAGLAPTTATGPRIGVTVGKQLMSFGTPPAVKAAWAGVLQPTYDTMKHLQKALDKVMRTVFAGHAAGNEQAIASFVNDRIIARRVAVMSQAIVVGGQSVGDVRIQDNEITSAIQGIHIGVSHRGQARTGPPDVTGRVTISGNRIAVLVPAEGARARHAIFVGNADRLRVIENDVSFSDLAEGDPLPSDGIRIHGFIGRAMTVRDNVVDSFPGGITMSLYQAKGGGQATLARMWAVEDNLIIGAATVSLNGPLKAFVKLRGNRPGPLDN